MLKFLDEFKKGIIVEQFLTKKCNYKCGFCMYNCSPDCSNEFVSDNILLKIKRQVDFLYSLGIRTTLNLLGGEPTLYFDKLDHIVDIVSNWSCAMTMPTNGWWLENDKNIDKFFDIFGRFVHNSGSSLKSNNGKGLCIQVSDEKYHQEWRRKDNNKENFEKMFKQEKYNKFKPHNDHPWIRWEVLSEHYYINPNGRGRDVSNARAYIHEIDSNRNGFCWSDINNSWKPGQFLVDIHYGINGDVESTCQFGNERSEMGNIDDNILYIIALEREYRNYRKLRRGYNCYNCNDMFVEWKKDFLEMAKDLYSPINTFDRKIFLENYNKINEIEYYYT